MKLVAGLESLGFAVIPSQANFVWCEHGTAPAKQLYERLKAERVLVRYMVYPRAGRRFKSVGTDGQIEALLALLKNMV